MKSNVEVVHLWPAVEAPASELPVSLDQLSEPEAQGCRLPRVPFPGKRDPSIVHGVKQDPQVIAHHNGAFNGQLHVRQVIAYCKNVTVAVIC